ncbi:Putative Flp pilus-assembly TadE/G-like [Selenomonas ruminantium]|uniref:Putative Flp pilus-assembly TadE/G-like n=1 Tax=Selenomonas ruminantium TaxID=971 RepID=A0A1M6U0A5_SELRU|nr:pilus assembly protein TadG-related protein [Selenomonas ruminantium]SHK62637.1 Putative Flp pilus-assembly TadE/G-like [Selenomonas ruminantium]
MSKYRNHMSIRWRQQGAILLFTALLLPLIITGVGLAVDIGNIYVQYSRLQNAADAAAVAGAHKYAEKNETEGAHPNADKMAAQYIQGEYHNLDPLEQLAEKTFKARKKENFTYYRVKLVKKVPLYFLRHFYGDGTFAVTVTGVAAINGEGNGGAFNNMFIFKERFDAVNAIEHPEKLAKDRRDHDAKDLIRTIYDGRIAYTKGDGVNNPSYRYKSLIYSMHGELDRFFTSKGQEYNLSHDIGDLMKDDESQKAGFASDGTLKDGYWSKAEYYNYDFKAFYDYMDQKTKETSNKPTDQNASTSNSLFHQDIVRVSNADGRIPSWNLNVDKSLGDSDKPIYIYIEAGVSTININLNADTGRPLIICVAGDNNHRSYINLALGGHTFKGVIYAPYSLTENGILVNADRSTFIGTIVGDSITLRGNYSAYKYKDYMGKDSGAAGGGKNNADGIALVSSPTGIQWD